MAKSITLFAIAEQVTFWNLV